MFCVAECREKGNAALDVVLFMPLALFFLFAVSDGGLTLVEQARLRDSVRAALHTEYLSDVVTLDSEAADELATAFAKELSQQLRESTDEISRQGVEVSIYTAEIARDSGELKRNTLERLGTSFAPAAGFPPEAIVASYPYVGRESYLEAELQGRGVHAFAEPIGEVFLPTGELDVSQRFAARVFFIYVDVRAVVTGINPAFAASALGRFYAMQLQQLQVVRTANR